jgi:hypothetical protein
MAISFVALCIHMAIFTTVYHIVTHKMMHSIDDANLRAALNATHVDSMIHLFVPESASGTYNAGCLHTYISEKQVPEDVGEWGLMEDGRAGFEATKFWYLCVPT